MNDLELFFAFFFGAFALVIFALAVLMFFDSWLDRRELRERRKRLEWLRDEPERDPWRAPWDGE